MKKVLTKDTLIRLVRKQAELWRLDEAKISSYENYKAGRANKGAVCGEEEDVRRWKSGRLCGFGNICIWRGMISENGLFD